MQKENRNNISGEMLHAIVNVWDQTSERFTVPIVGRSMYPLIREGDYVQCTGILIFLSGFQGGADKRCFSVFSR